MATITFRQPFFDGNRETAFMIIVDFLRRNGFDLVLKDADDRKKMYLAQGMRNQG
jgi:prophage maintenance system killer protein